MENSIETLKGGNMRENLGYRHSVSSWAIGVLFLRDVFGNENRVLTNGANAVCQLFRAVKMHFVSFNDIKFLVLDFMALVDAQDPPPTRGQAPLREQHLAQAERSSRSASNPR